MNDLSSDAPYNGVKCMDNQTYDDMQANGILGCGSDFSIPYFVSFVIIITFVSMNLSVAAVIDGLSSARKDEGALICSDDIDYLITLWSEYDPKATGWVTIESLVFLIFELPHPLGMNREFPIDSFASKGLFKTLKHINMLQSKIKNKELINFEQMHDSEDIFIFDDTGKRFLRSG